MKKIISLLIVTVFLMGMCVIPASADILATLEVAVDKADVSVADEVTVSVNATGKFTIYQVELKYDKEYLEYKADSITTHDSKVKPASGDDLSDGAMVIESENFDLIEYKGDAMFTVTFKALKKTETPTALDVEVYYSADDEAYVLMHDLGFYAVEEFECKDKSINILLPPAAPKAENVTIEGTAKIGETLKLVDYDYTDINGDVESGTAFQWYADGEIIDDATAEEFVVTADEFGKKIKLGVTPKTTTGGDDLLVGEEAFSAETEAVVANDTAATVENEAFDGKFKVGKEVTLVYDFVSVNGGEDKSTFAWVLVAEDGTETPIADESIIENTYKFVKADAGKTLKVTITPMDARNEVAGEAVVVTAAETVAKASSSNGGYKPNSGANLAGKTPEEDKKDDEKDPEVDPTPVESKFADVDAEKYAWAVEYINALAEASIFKGYDDGNFKPEEKITRAQFAALVARVLGLEGVEELAYADLEGHWAAKEVSAVAKLGALDFIADAFAPDQAITREEMAAVLYKALVASEVEISAAEVEEFTDASSIADYAVEAVKALQVLEILEGMGDGTFAPKGETTRAQAAKVIYLFAELVK